MHALKKEITCQISMAPQKKQSHQHNGWQWDQEKQSHPQIFWQCKILKDQTMECMFVHGVKNTKKK